MEETNSVDKTEEKSSRPQNKNLIPGGPGRPKGQRNYATIYREALIKLAELNGMEPEQMETDILLRGMSKARKGDYRFWKDILDRLHGQPVKKTQLVDEEGNSIAPVLVQFKREPGKPDSN